MLINDYERTLTEGQSLVIRDVILQASKSDVTKEVLKATRTKVVNTIETLYGLDFLGSRVRLGYEPSWKDIDVDWDLVFKSLFEKKRNTIDRVIGFLGIHTSLLNFVYGLSIPNNLSKEEEYSVAVAIVTAAILFQFT